MTTRQTLVPSSLLDRLLDDAPEESSEAVPEAWHDLPGYKRAVARDLEALLNTRCAAPGQEGFPAFPRADASVLMFGIPDLSSLSLLDPAHRAFLQDALRHAIARYEPRLSNVRVSLDGARGLHQALRFRVDGLLRTFRTRPPVSFDAMLQLSSNTYRVKG
ncbi:MAG TPA: type VI secretion system baseplate subunit TssE [Holophaga sp.]|nr:type VI secretion system baseplate subunit TssE [Holophaga sp.]